MKDIIPNDLRDIEHKEDTSVNLVPFVVLAFLEGYYSEKEHIENALSSGLMDVDDIINHHHFH